jgi:hypothetical protein
MMPHLPPKETFLVYAKQYRTAPKLLRSKRFGERFSSAQSLPRNSNAWGAFRRYAFAPGSSTHAVSVVGAQHGGVWASQNV